MPLAGFTSFQGSKTTRKIMRVNNFAIFCELDRALMPVAPRVSLCRPRRVPRPVLAISFSYPVPGGDGVLHRKLRDRRMSPVVSGVPLVALPLSVRQRRLDSARAVAHRRRTPLRRRLLAVRYCDPVRGHKEKAGLVPAFSFAVVNLGELPGRLHRARKRRSEHRGGSDSVLRRTTWWILGGPLPSLQLSCWKLALRAFILLR